MTIAETLAEYGIPPFENIEKEHVRFARANPDFPYNVYDRYATWLGNVIPWEARFEPSGEDISEMEQSEIDAFLTARNELSPRNR